MKSRETTWLRICSGHWRFLQRGGPILGFVHRVRPGLWDASICTEKKWPERDQLVGSGSMQRAKNLVEAEVYCRRINPR